MGVKRYAREILTMQKDQSTDGQVQGQTRSLSKKWKKIKVSQTKSTPTCSWKSLGHSTWSSVGGKRLVLTPVHLLQLTELERLTLQKLAHSKLQTMGLGCQIVIPKDSRAKRSKSRVFTLKKRSSSSGLLENLNKDKTKDGKDASGSGFVFGMTLSKVLTVDRDIGHRCPCPLRERRDSTDLTRQERKWSTSSGCGLSTESLSESDSRSTGSTLLDALSLSSTGKLDLSKEQDHKLQPHTPHVPYIVHCCFNHLEKYGLNVLGIFRIGSSKKRLKQLREEFDSGEHIELGEESSPHDTGGLLKEFFRDLPDPLLTRDLYAAFIATRKLKDVHKRLHALRLLISLLPVANRDTLFALLRFLNVVVAHSKDTVNQYGEQVQGNKMDGHNLATLFGPNILHKSKGGEFQVESQERADQRTEVIAVVKELIDNYVHIFELPNDVQDEMYRAMLETDPESLDILLRRKCHMQGGDMDGESSSVCEESDSLSASQTSDSLRLRTQSDASAMVRTQSDASVVVQEQSSLNHRQRPRTFNEALAIQKQQQSAHIQDSEVHNAHRHHSKQSDSHHNAQKQDSQRPYSVHSQDSTKLQNSQRQESHRPVIRRDRISSAKEIGQHSQGKQMHRLSTPDNWNRESPRVSPSPKAMKSTMPDVRVRITPEVPNQPAERPNFLTSVKTILSPRASRKKEQQQFHQNSSGNHLTVPPTFSRTNSGRDKNASNSSLSSGYFGGSSRSGTTSPVTPEQPQVNKWYLETPPQTPPSAGGKGTTAFDFSQDPGTSPFHRTSSLHRPLGITQTLSPPSPGLPHWQAERWKHWEQVAKQRSDEFKEQETLV